MSTPTREQVEALCAWMESFDDAAMQSARTLHYDFRARVVPVLRALLAEMERQAAELATLREQVRDWKRDYCEGLSGRDCLATCDTFGHDDACPATHLYAAWEIDKALLREANIRTAQIHDTLAEVVTGEWDTPTMAVLAVAEVKRLREDAARLDWLEDYGLTITLDPGHKVIGPDRGHIDAARREGGA